MKNPELARRWLADAHGRLPPREPQPGPDTPSRRRVTLRSILARKPKEPRR